MGKKIKFGLLMLLMIIIGSCFVGCNNKYTTIELTRENYDDYISVMIELSDYNIIMLEESYTDGEYYYTASVLVHYKTQSRKDNLIFEDVSIEYDLQRSGLWITGSTINPKVLLTETGNSSHSFGAMIEDVGIESASHTQILTISNITRIKSIKGRVLIPNT